MTKDEIHQRTAHILRKNWFIRDKKEKAYFRDDWYKVKKQWQLYELSDTEWDAQDFTSYWLIWFMFIHSLIITYC